jgi:formylglycine-generating enzyme required for sulfatase activity
LFNISTVQTMNVTLSIQVPSGPSADSIGPGRGDGRASFEPETVRVPAGSFLMGSDGGPDVREHERPSFELMLPVFRIGRYPVTNAQYLEFARRARVGIPPEMGWELTPDGHEPPAGKADHPATGISWDEAAVYCRWLRETTGRGYRLPSEAEWERAARGIDGRRYPWGDEFAPGRCNSREAGIGATTAVAEYAGLGDSAAGCSDMAGNVWEWTSTIWGIDRSRAEFGRPYRSDDGRESALPALPFRELRICRGGSFREAAERVTCTVRGREPADGRDRRRGFRVALDE